MARGAFREPTSSNVRASEWQLVVHCDVPGDMSIMRDQALVLDLAMRGMASGSHQVICDDATWWQVIL